MEQLLGCFAPFLILECNVFALVYNEHKLTFSVFLPAEGSYFNLREISLYSNSTVY